MVLWAEVKPYDFERLHTKSKLAYLRMLTLHMNGLEKQPEGVAAYEDACRTAVDFWLSTTAFDALE